MVASSMPPSPSPPPGQVPEWLYRGPVGMEEFAAKWFRRVGLRTRALGRRGAARLRLAQQRATGAMLNDVAGATRRPLSLATVRVAGYVAAGVGVLEVTRWCAEDLYAMHEAHARRERTAFRARVFQEQSGALPGTSRGPTRVGRFGPESLSAFFRRRSVRSAPRETEEAGGWGGALRGWGRGGGGDWWGGGGAAEAQGAEAGHDGDGWDHGGGVHGRGVGMGRRVPGLATLAALPAELVERAVDGAMLGCENAAIAATAVLFTMRDLPGAILMFPLQVAFDVAFELSPLMGLYHEGPLGPGVRRLERRTASEVADALYTGFDFVGPKDGIMSRYLQDQSHYRNVLYGGPGARKVANLARVAYDKKGYVFHEDGRLNVFGIRNPCSVPNYFDDVIVTVQRVGDEDADGAGQGVAPGGSSSKREWMVGFYAATTEPGLKALQERSFSGDKGCAVLKPGQYKYCIGQHAYLYTALCQAGKVNVWRNPRGFGTSLDANYGSGKGVITEEGHFGINIHRASPVGGVRRVDDYSAGCQVMQHSEDFEVFMMDARIHADRFGNSFLYALFDCSDILFWQNAPLPHETTFETMCRVVSDSVFREKRNALYRKVAQGVQEWASYLTARPRRLLQEHLAGLAFVSPPVLDAADALEGVRLAAGAAGAQAADLFLAALDVPRAVSPRLEWPTLATRPGWASRGAQGRALLLASEGAAQCVGYVVKEGQYAASIAYELRVDFDDLVELNPNVDLEYLAVGQKILVPNKPRW